MKEGIEYIRHENLENFGFYLVVVGFLGFCFFVVSEKMVLGIVHSI